MNGTSKLIATILVVVMSPELLLGWIGSDDGEAPEFWKDHVVLWCRFETDGADGTFQLTVLDTIAADVDVPATVVVSSRGISRVENALTAVAVTRGNFAFVCLRQVGGEWHLPPKELEFSPSRCAVFVPKAHDDPNINKIRERVKSARKAAATAQKAKQDRLEREAVEARSRRERETRLAAELAQELERHLEARRTSTRQNADRGGDSPSTLPVCPHPTTQQSQ